MAVTPTAIFVQAPYYKALSFAAQTACTTRAPTATASLAAANIVAITAASTNGLRIDSITINACSSSITAPTAANVIDIWMWDGTNAYVLVEIPITVVTPSASAAAFTTTYTFSQPLNVPAANILYASLGVTTTAATTALQIQLFGGQY